ncbi:RNAse P Rpr2/Rpp21/SNM1 subunit domain-containing protein [Carex littledalei]|uniref:RNAse P Rpr2/Rpp21/SNM1 subunit domain-containing protein n=1 Tax=Carex littledalei TaxID=544730 RepID=A0A833QQJ0_9POAL|nr:RNAse P Rpr2/Rpp21/SNM1 subunit domain-containing protein [Carex littledalei]
MGRKGSSTLSQGATKYTNNMTLREENIGRKHADVASILKLQHLTRVATWASGAGQIPPLGSILGQRTADTAEASGLLLDPSSFLCQKCETILCPGVNCTIRIKKNTRKSRQSQNNVVYTCCFCLHENLKRGTPKGTVKNLLASTPRKSIDATPKIGSRCTLEEATTNSPETPMPKMLTTSDHNRSNNKRNDFSSLSASNEVGSGSKKRQRKGWTSLKDKAKADASESAKRINSFASPFKI